MVTYRRRAVHSAALAVLAGFLGIVAFAGTASAECVHPQGNIALDPYGDVTGNGFTTVADSQCLLVVILAEIQNPPAPLPACLQTSTVEADLDCDGSVTISDALVSIFVAISADLTVEIDGDQDGCVDACTACVGPFEQSCLIDGSCVGQGAASGADPCVGCDADQSDSGSSTLPNGTNCGVGLECIDGACVPQSASVVPTGVFAAAGNESADILWTAPEDPPETVLGYAVTVYAPGGGPPAGVTGDLTRLTGSTGTSFTFTGLTNGTQYAFTVAAVGGSGVGFESDLSNTITPAGLPGAPINVVAAAADSSAVVSFSPPLTGGSGAITGYQITTYPGGSVTSVAGSPATITGLTNGVPVFFTVRAVTAAGAGADSAPSNTVIPTALPGAPTIIDAQGQDGQIAIIFVAPTDTGGGALTGYVGSCTGAGGASVGTGFVAAPSGTGIVPITVIVPGLTNGTPHSCTVSATNAAGEGPPSAPIDLIVPNAVVLASGILVARPVTLMGTTLIDPVFEEPVWSIAVARPVAFGTDTAIQVNPGEDDPTSGIVARPIAFGTDTAIQVNPGDTDPTSGIVARPIAFGTDTAIQVNPGDEDPTSGIVARPVAFGTDTAIQVNPGDDDPTAGIVARPVAFGTDTAIEVNAGVDTDIAGVVAQPVAWVTDTDADFGQGAKKLNRVVSAPVVTVGRPFVSGIDPTGLSVTSPTVDLTLNGLDFYSVTSVLFYDPTGTLSTALSAGSPTVAGDGQSLMVTVSVDPGATLGEWTAVVVTSNGIASVVDPPPTGNPYDNTLQVTN